jgi:plastocyanin
LRVSTDVIRIASALTAVTLVLVASACGGGGSSASDQITEASGASGEPATATGTLEGEVGPGFEIEVRQNGEDAESVKAGTYTLKVEDKADIHNFHLIGPGVDNVVTSVSFVGEKTVTVTVKKGTYTYQCDPHASSGMKGTFTVT